MPSGTVMPLALNGTKTEIGRWLCLRALNETNISNWLGARV
jgi:hypothetical protein